MKKAICIFLAVLALSIGVYAQKESSNKADKEIPRPVKLEKQAVKSLRSGRILLNFDSADIRIVAKLMSELTGKNIVLDDNVSGRITILSSHEISTSEAWALFKSALRSYGYHIINKGSYVKIVPSKKAKTERTRFYSEQNVATSEDYLVAVLKLKNADPGHIATVLRTLVTEIGNVTPHAPSKTILIADEAFNVKRLVKIAQHLDSREQKMFVKTFKLQYAPSESVFKSLREIYQPQKKGTYISDFSVNNSIVVMASRGQLNEISKIIEQLDRKSNTREKTRRFRVYYLQNANAEDLAKIISTMLKEGSAVEQKTSPTKSKKGKIPPAGREKSFISTKVSSDEDTNSLIMYLTDVEFDEVERLVRKLDTPRKQVLVSAVIAEVSLKRLQSTGANWQVLNENGVGAAFGGGKSMESLYQTLASGNFIMGGMGKNTRTINVGGRKIEYPDVFALISFLNEDNDFNLLSAPRILTLDHKEAIINVGSIIPFATGVKFDTNGQPIVTYDYKDIGLELKITPHVSQGKYVKMEVKQKIQDVTDYIQQNLGALGYVVPVVSTREIETNITVGNAQTIIIGGLVSKKTIDSIKKVPILGDLPILGFLFKNRQKQHDKTTLFIFLTPHIIETPQTLVEMTERYQHFIEEEFPKKGQKVKDPDLEKKKEEEKNKDRELDK
ncbi:MAG: type II secretion system secretin GspD [Candidatus Eremiobacteraeota bacterium]|nr:type II secretion system secretin GspD [Candidatus Eremiobacteraeota bacterium]